jgi:drug/metabolite transporter (DMT)-like permease
MGQRGVIRLVLGLMLAAVFFVAASGAVKGRPTHVDATRALIGTGLLFAGIAVAGAAGRLNPEWRDRVGFGWRGAVVFVVLAVLLWVAGRQLVPS